MTPRSLTVCLLAGLLTGCSSVAVIKNPDAGDTGIRYWRPKPYLLVTPADATGRMVKLKLEYLPDYSEEYSIHPQGKKPPQVQLKDGWNLVAVGGPAPPPEKPEEAPPPPAPAADQMKLPEYVVAATNIPIGYYESVFDTSGTKKYLKGWRYVGMTPMGGGNPTGVDRSGLPNGGLPPGCTPPPAGSSIGGPLYGMVFFNGVMTFRQLDEIANNMTCPQYVKLIPDAPAPIPAANKPTVLESDKPDKLKTDLEQEGVESRPVDISQPETPSPGTPPPGAWNGKPNSWLRNDGKLVQTSTKGATAKSKIPPPRVWDSPPIGK